MTDVFDNQNRKHVLGREIGKGGEGTVYEFGQNHVVKMYHKPMSNDDYSKYHGMVSSKTEQIIKVAAWPLDFVFNSSRIPIGIVLPKVDGKEIHKLYGPKSRLVDFPEAEYKFLLYTALNVAKACGLVHQHGHIIGDVNPNNLFITTKATAVFIDCDSFQITANGKIFTCGVGVDTHTPPELQGIDLSSIVRTSNHDSFGLAVTIFHLLFLGRHPFSGIYLGSGDMPIDRAIKESRFAYGTDAKSRAMKPPPATLPLELFPSTIISLFNRSFLKEHQNNRPMAAEWVAPLDYIITTVKVCSNHPGHTYWNLLNSCPWCEIDARSGTSLFPFIQRGRQGASFNLQMIESQLVAILPPQPIQISFNSSSLPPPTQNAVNVKAQAKKGLGKISLIFGMNSVFNSHCQGLKMTLQNANNRYVELTKQIEIEHRSNFLQHGFNEFLALKQEYLGLPAKKMEMLKQLENNGRQHQLALHLRAYRLERHAISGIGEGRKATLQSFGIENAEDLKINSILSVPGFGPTLANALLAWRKSIEATFRFNPNRAIDPEQIRSVNNQIALK